MKQTYLIGGNRNASRNRNTRTRKRTRHTVWPFQRQTARYVKTLASRNSNWRTSVFGPVKARGGACLPPPPPLGKPNLRRRKSPDVSQCCDVTRWPLLPYPTQVAGTSGLLRPVSISNLIEQIFIFNKTTNYYLKKKLITFRFWIFRQVVSLLLKIGSDLMKTAQSWKNFMCVVQSRRELVSISRLTHVERRVIWLTAMRANFKQISTPKYK